MSNNDISTKVSSRFTLNNFLLTESRKDLINEIYAGLSKEQKYISSRFFYNDRGSDLFEEITVLPEYYPTRTEKSILRSNALEILGEFDKVDIIELGSGDCSKISILLDAVPENKMIDVRYVPVDVSEAAIIKSADSLSMKYTGLNILGLLADFQKHLVQFPGSEPRLICFFGSTLGNLRRKQARDFLINIKRLMQPGDRFLLGLDMVKDIDILHDAYNDKQGVTALFNQNILYSVNEISETDFDPDDFEHVAWYNKEKERIEMHLKAKVNMEITSRFFPSTLFLKAGETIHTENSHKFTMDNIHEFSTVAGLKIEQIFTDSRRWFSLIMFGNQRIDFL